MLKTMTNPLFLKTEVLPSGFRYNLEPLKPFLIYQATVLRISNRYAVSPKVFPENIYPDFVIGSFYILDRLYFLLAHLISTF